MTVVYSPLQFFFSFLCLGNIARNFVRKAEPIRHGERELAEFYGDTNI